MEAWNKDARDFPKVFYQKGFFQFHSGLKGYQNIVNGVPGTWFHQKNEMLSPVLSCETILFPLVISWLVTISKKREQKNKNPNKMDDNLCAVSDT